MSKSLQTGQYASQKGTVAEGHVQNLMILGEGVAAPADGLAGYEEGCIFIVRGASPSFSHLVNMGTSASCLFRNGSGGGSLFRTVPGVAGGVAPATTGADVVVAVYSVPANFFGMAGSGLQANASGSFAVNGDTKTAKLWFNPSAAVVGSAVTGGTLVGSTGAVATSGGSWEVQGNVFKRGVAGSNTQTVIGEGGTAGAVATGQSPNVDTTAVENAPILIAVTINCATTASDCTLNWFEVDAY